MLKIPVLPADEKAEEIVRKFMSDRLIDPVRDYEYGDNNDEGYKVGIVSEAGTQPIETHHKDTVDVGSILLPYYTKIPDAVVKNEV